MSFEIPSFIGTHPLNLIVDDSPELQAYVAKVHRWMAKPGEKGIDEKLEKIFSIVTRALQNWGTAGFDILFSAPADRVDEKKALLSRMPLNCNIPISEALQMRVGTWKFQAVLFFLLASEAKLGQRNNLQLVEKVCTDGEKTYFAFDEIYDDQGNKMVVIFTDNDSPHIQKDNENPLQPKTNGAMDYLSYAIEPNGLVHRFSRWGMHAYDRALNENAGFGAGAAAAGANVYLKIDFNRR